MDINFRYDDNGQRILEIDDAQITFRNFEGRASKKNREGDRNFVLIIPDQEIADALIADENEFGISWNVKIKEPKEEGDKPFIYLPVKMKFNKRTSVYLKSGASRVRMTEEMAKELDDLLIDHVDLDIAALDGISEISGKPFRSAWLRAIEIVQRFDRFQARNN